MVVYGDVTHTQGVDAECCNRQTYDCVRPGRMSVGDACPEDPDAFLDCVLLRQHVLLLCSEPSRGSATCRPKACEILLACRCSRNVSAELVQPAVRGNWRDWWVLLHWWNVIPKYARGGDTVVLHSCTSIGCGADCDFIL